jgi:hypothetical protein
MFFRSSTQSVIRRMTDVAPDQLKRAFGATYKNLLSQEITQDESHGSQLWIFVDLQNLGIGSAPQVSTVNMPGTPD